MKKSSSKNFTPSLNPQPSRIAPLPPLITDPNEAGTEVGRNTKNSNGRSTYRESLATSGSKSLLTPLGCLSPWTTASNNRQYKKVYPNRVFTQWYRRYVNKLPEAEQLDFQPYEEVQRVDEDIALQYFNGEDGHLTMFFDRDEVEKRRKALQRYNVIKEQEEKERIAAAEEREFEGKGGFRIRATKAGIMEDVEFGATDTQKKVLNPIIHFLHKMQTKKRRTLYFVLLAADSKWRVLHRPQVRRKLAQMYKTLKQEKSRAKFRKIIGLVIGVMRFITSIRIISGNTKQILIELENFRALQEKVSVYRPGWAGSKKKIMFDCSKYTFKELPIPFSTQMTLTKPWFLRKDEETTSVVKVLQDYKSFVQYPPVFQRRLARVAWLIEIEENKYIIRERHLACDFYVLLKGKAMEVRLVGDPYLGKKGEMIMTRIIRKNVAFGDESMSEPECSRDYSIISCEPCTLLAVSVYDYHTMLHTRSENESAPEHIIFLSNLLFLEDFPKKKLLEEGDENITIHYFRPDSVIAKDLKASKYVFVIINGNCRVISEMLPEKLLPSLKIAGNKLKEDDKKRYLRHGPPAFKTVVDPGPAAEVVKRMNLGTVKAVFDIQKKRQGSVLGFPGSAISSEINLLKAKARKIVSTLPKPLQKIYDVDRFSRRVSLSNINKPFPSALDSSSIKSFLSLHSSFESLIGAEEEDKYVAVHQDPFRFEPTDVSDDDESLRDSDSRDGRRESRPSGEFSHLRRLSTRRNSEGHDVTRVQDKGETGRRRSRVLGASVPEAKKEDQPIRWLKDPVFPEFTRADQQTTSMNKIIECQNSSDSSQCETLTSTGGPVFNCQDIPRGTRRSSGCSKWSCRSDEKKMLEDPKYSSRWKSIRFMNRGDYVGQEWLDFRKKPFEPPTETWSLVSDGSEIIMIKKTFLLKYLRKEW